jgi:hypothetical protein
MTHLEMQPKKKKPMRQMKPMTSSWLWPHSIRIFGNTGWIIYDLLNISVYGDGWKSIQKSLANKKIIDQLTKSIQESNFSLCHVL